MTRRVLVLIAACLPLLAAPAALAFEGGGGILLPNVDIRALEPPIDVTPEQLRAQRPPQDQRLDPQDPARSGTVFSDSIRRR